VLKSPTRTLLELLLSAAAGFVAFLAPVILDPPKAWPVAPLFPVVRETVEHVHPASFVAVALVGLLAGFLGRANWAILGLGTMALLPLCTIAEIAADSTSHNLFPFEFVMYAVFALPAVGAAGLGRIARARLRPRPA
jgi:hypothetical protein